MEGKHWDLHGEGDEDQQERQQLQAHRHADQRKLDVAREHICWHCQVLHTGNRATSLLMEVEQDDTNQHENTAKERVKQELPS